MSTSCKLIIGYTNNTGYWNVSKEYIRWSDGYDEAIIPILKKYKGNIAEINENMDYDSWKFELIKPNERIEGEYLYYLDMSNTSKIRCSIVKLDWDFFEKYGVDS